MKRRGFPPFLIDVKRIAQLIIDHYGDVSRVIGVNWIYRFHKAHPDIKARLSQSRNAQRAKNKDSYVIRPWFQRVHITKQKYGILNKDIYNFDETSFAIGLIIGSRSSKVLTLLESIGRATLI
jgi:hypothetical protein